MAEPRDTLRLIAIPRLMFIVLAIWGAWYAARRSHRHALGTVIVDRTSFTVDACKKVPVAGPGSIGVDLRAGDRNVLRVIRDESGVQLWLYPKDTGVATLVDRRDCSQWDVGFFSEAPDVLAAAGGYVTFTCAVGGGKIDGTASFDHCGS